MCHLFSLPLPTLPVKHVSAFRLICYASDHTAHLIKKRDLVPDVSLSKKRFYAC